MRNNAHAAACFACCFPCTSLSILRQRDHLQTDKNQTRATQALFGHIFAPGLERPEDKKLWEERGSSTDEREAEAEDLKESAAVELSALVDQAKAAQERYGSFSQEQARKSN